MFDQRRAAEWLVVAWCKHWTLAQYVRAIMESPEGDLPVHEAVEAFPWLTKYYSAYPRSVREFIGGAYPKLSAWLFARPTDADRLRCAEQIQRLRCPDRLKGYVKAEDRREMKASSKDAGAAALSYQLSRESFKTHQRSAWNVCK